MIKEYAKCDAVGLAEHIQKGDFTAKEVVASAIEMAEKYDPKLNSIVVPMFESALEAADTSVSGQLSGVPMLLKDACEVEGVKTCYGSKFWADHVSGCDSQFVKRYRSAGVSILGKSNMPELGLTATTEGVLWGACRNPWNLSLTAGGSSGGSAAAVAARIVPVAHASDGGGSIRGPASCCGLVGLKPSRARISMAPTKGEGWGGLASNHVVTRSVRDSALFLDISHGPVPGDPYCAPHFEGSYFHDHVANPGKLRIALDLAPVTGTQVHQSCTTATYRAAALLEELGHRVEEVSPEFDRNKLLESGGNIVVANTYNSVQVRAEELGRQPAPEELEVLTWRCVEAGKQMSAHTYIQALKCLHETGRHLEAFFSQYDVILSPTHLQPPPALGWIDTNLDDADVYNSRMNDFWGLTSLYNATGAPAISLPLAETDDGIPIGIQLGAAFGQELLLLQLGSQLEQCMPWGNKVPSM